MSAYIRGKTGKRETGNACMPRYDLMLDSLERKVRGPFQAAWKTFVLDKQKERRRIPFLPP